MLSRERPVVNINNMCQLHGNKSIFMKSNAWIRCPDRKTVGQSDKQEDGLTDERAEVVNTSTMLGSF